MKTIPSILMAAILAAGRLGACAQSTNEPPATAPAAALPVSAPVTPTLETTNQTAAVVPSTGTEPGATNAEPGLRLNFNNAPLDLVLKYLSDAAGFHILMETTVRGNITVISSHPMSADEAVELLNNVLNRNGAAAIRNGQFLTIVDQRDARKRDVPVRIYNDNPDSIPKSAEIVTQIIPIRYVEARQLASDLAPFVSDQATIVANEAGNSIVITDTQANIRHLTEIIKAIDSGAEASTEIRVFRLRYANPTDVASVLSGIFPAQSGTGGSQTPIRFGGGRGFPGGAGGRFAGFFGGQGGNNNSAQSSTQDRIRKQQQVVAVADARTSSVVVTAQKELMDQIAEMMDQLDVPSERDQKVTVFHVENGDPQQMVQVLQNAFGGTTTTARGGTSGSQNSALTTRQQQNAQQMGNPSSSSSSILGNNRSGGQVSRGTQF
jgi:type II secretory pathway component GspD/PulD (secretin)